MNRNYDKSEFDFESNNKVKESLHMNLWLQASKLDRPPVSYKLDQGTCFADKSLCKQIQR